MERKTGDRLVLPWVELVAMGFCAAIASDTKLDDGAASSVFLLLAGRSVRRALGEQLPALTMSELERTADLGRSAKQTEKDLRRELRRARRRSRRGRVRS